VVDEADRMLNQSYHNWVTRVSTAAFSQVKGDLNFTHPGLNFKCELNITTCRHLVDAVGGGSTSGVLVVNTSCMYIIWKECVRERER
jgi:hypothetical protein